jgi:hypothetical protein
MELASTPYKEALKVAENIDKKLLCTNFHPDDMVMIIHQEGTVLNYRSALLRKWKDWIFIFTEHHGTHVYHNTDLEGCFQYKSVKIEKQAGTGYTDKCMLCGKIDDVAKMCYGNESYEEWQILCENCYEVRYTDNRDLWIRLNSKGYWNFLWGACKEEDLRKACATVMKEEFVDTWLNTPSEGFPHTPLKIFKEIDYETVWLSIWQMGSGDVVT